MVFNDILIYTSFQFELIRQEQPDKELAVCNIECTDFIMGIADTIYNDPVIQKYLATSKVEREDYWIKNTDEGFFDSYVENQAHEMITIELNL
jgi:hypothetical protein